MALELSHCTCRSDLSENRRDVVRFGSYFRKSDRALIQRFKCRVCLRTFSTASFESCVGQKKRHVNHALAGLLVSGVSQRRSAKFLKLNRKTVVRKFVFLALMAKTYLAQKNLEYPVSEIIEFDDLETIEHTKLKPLSVTLAVESGTRRILGFSVSQMPAKGHLVYLSVAKYGSRRDRRRYGRAQLFKTIKPLIKDHAVIKSDQNPHYTFDVKRHFPNATHATYKGRRSSVAGQGELKKIGNDPLFSLNHTCAMLRANITRLFRKTWCTTKKKERLALHLYLYAVYHNENLKKSA